MFLEPFGVLVGLDPTPFDRRGFYVVCALIALPPERKVLKLIAKFDSFGSTFERAVSYFQKVLKRKSIQKNGG